MPTALYPFGNPVPTFGRGNPPTPAQTGTLPAYNLSPQPTYGQGPYGMVPGQIGAPPSIYSQTTGVAPALGTATPMVGQNILNELAGQIDPQTLRNMQDAAAKYGVTSGMPGSNAIPGSLAFNANLRNIGLNSMAVQRQGQQDYLSALSGIGAQQLNPALLTQIAESNAQLAAAPDPAQAAQLQMQLYQQALNAARGPGGSTTRSVGGASGTGTYSGLTPGQSPLGSTPYGTPSGSYSLSTGFQPGDFEAMGFSDYQSPYGYGDWQAGMPSSESWGAPITGLDMFGDLGGGTDPYAGYSGGFQPGDFEAMFGG